jgi:hypothetical protein
MPMDAVPSKRLRTSVSYDTAKVDPTLCIICQSTEQNLSSTENGRKRVVEAATIRKDHVSERLKLVDNDNFVYHVTNECYKGYTLQKTLDRML